MFKSNNEGTGSLGEGNTLSLFYSLDDLEKIFGKLTPVGCFYF